MMKAEQLAINIDQQSLLARLLAQENIHVIHGAYKTAWFDPSKRTLALPIWHNKGKAVYDLLTGHEVGHALYTPAKGWHDAVDDIKGAPKAYLNILEDVRIERLIKDRYPGLLSQFQKAYKILADEDFFGLAKAESLGTQISDLIVIDRINIFYKIGAHVDVKFNSREQVFVDRAYTTQTFDDVVALAKEIYAYQKSLRLKQAKKKKVVELPQPDMDEESLITNIQPDMDTSSDYEKPEEDEETSESKSESSITTEDTSEDVSEDETTDTTKGEGTSEDAQTEEETEGDGDDEEVVENKPESDVSVDGPSEEELEEDASAYTDDEFRSRENELIANTGRSMIYTAGKTFQKDILIDYKEYYAEWKKDLNVFTQHDHWLKDTLVNQLKALDEHYKKFKVETEQAAAYMAKEFEMRKAAFQYSRATVHKTGTLNTNKLHNYKVSEDIFLRSTKLANYKNHGMMLFIDFSGSMQSNIGATIRQTINLAAFCRMINIPYEVYAFTTRVREDDYNSADFRMYSDSELIMQKFNLLNLMSSRMKRTEHNDAQRMLWNLSRAWDGEGLNQYYINKWNRLHSTPLNSAILYSEKLIKSFKAKHGIDKMTAMFLSDGDSDSFQIRLDELADDHRVNTANRYDRCFIRAMGKTFDCEGVTTSGVTRGLLQSLKASADVTTLGFFISDYRNEAISKAIEGVRQNGKVDYSKREKFTKQIQDKRVIIEDGIFGYDRYFGLCAKYMDVIEDELDELVEDGATKSKIKTAFTKASKQKRVNRILLNAFVDAIA